MHQHQLKLSIGASLILCAFTISRGARNRDWYGERLRPYFAYNKPVIIITEVGCCTYQGAENAGGGAWAIVSQTNPGRLNGDYVRDEGLQARELKDLLIVLEDEGVDGVFVFTFVAPALAQYEDPRYDLDMASYSLVKSYTDKHGMTYPDMPWEPKESFNRLLCSNKN